jgi:hypothetical protein
MKQTAVEWLVEKLDEQKFITKSQIYIAEKMEKEQIIKAVFDSMGTNIDPNIGRAEQYYNETFKNTKE